MTQEVAASQTATSGGRKYDGGKVRYELLPPFAIEDVAKVLTYGSVKYEDDNWRIVPDAVRRYKGALMRHVEEYRKGNVFDDETGLPHMAHAICCAMFILELDRINYDQLASTFHEKVIERFKDK
jgi:hypothetical protein